MLHKSVWRAISGPAVEHVLLTIGDMIVLTLAYGAPFIKKFFERCLPSLLSPGNLPFIRDESPELCLMTLHEDLEIINQYLSQSQITDTFSNRIHILPLGLSRTSDVAITSEFKSIVTTNLLCRAADLCLKRDKSFFMAVPDLIYSDDTIKICWPLHRLSGKVVAIFNGRVCPKLGRDVFTSEELPKPGNGAHSMRDFFFQWMNDDWRRLTTTNPDVIPGNDIGRIIFQDSIGTHIFFRNPNPTLGKFTTDDLFFFSLGHTIGSWDRTWLSTLMKTNRVIVQTNIDACMSIEPEQRSAMESVRNMSVPWTNIGITHDTMAERLIGKFLNDDMETRRRHQFSDRYGHFCFTSRAAPLIR